MVGNHSPVNHQKDEFERELMRTAAILYVFGPLPILVATIVGFCPAEEDVGLVTEIHWALSYRRIPHEKKRHAIFGFTKSGEDVVKIVAASC